MGLFVNPNNINFQEALDSPIYVDKSMLVAEINRLVKTNKRFFCVSRSRRFGKTMAGNIVAADVKLVANSFGNMLLAREPVAGFGVGVAFSLISAWKIPLMIFADLLPRFHFDDTYLRRSSWEKSLKQ